MRPTKRSAPVQPNRFLVSSADKYQFSRAGRLIKDILFPHGSQPSGIVLSKP